MTDEPGVEDRLQVGPVQAALLAQAPVAGEIGLGKLVRSHEPGRY
ncbi:hypothetical protein M2160_001984 [Streptomyces sp. SAI-117]|nr:hypothetical protein [Streptomyces sp. SAI-117]MDH6566963.1 hypothetical protein [Streptomyces sp. SAI-117]